MRAEVVSVSQQDCLAQRRYAHGESRSIIAKIKFEVVAAIEQVAPHNRVATQLQVHTRHPIKVVRMCGQRAFDPTKFHARARWITIVHERAKRSGIAGGNRIWAKGLQRSHALASRKTS